MDEGEEARGELVETQGNMTKPFELEEERLDQQILPLRYDLFCWSGWIKMTGHEGILGRSRVISMMQTILRWPWF